MAWACNPSIWGAEERGQLNSLRLSWAIQIFLNSWSFLPFPPKFWDYRYVPTWPANKKNYRFKIVTTGPRRVSVGKGPWHASWHPEFDPQNRWETETGELVNIYRLVSLNYTAQWLETLASTRWGEHRWGQRTLGILSLSLTDTPAHTQTHTEVKV